ncbi:MAG: hypothetical protein ACI8YQ_001010 [Polaribacter sp.]|jgi:hypothetical protein
MGFVSAAQSSLNSNRKIRSSNKRGFKPSKDKFSVKIVPKLEFTEENKKRAQAKRRRKDMIMLSVMIFVATLFGIAFYNWIKP